MPTFSSQTHYSLLFPPIIASGGDEAVQKRPGTIYYERNCKGATFSPGGGGGGLPGSTSNIIPPGIPDRPLNGQFGNSIDDRNPRPGSTDTQGINACKRFPIK